MIKISIITELFISLIVYLSLYFLNMNVCDIQNSMCFMSKLVDFLVNDSFWARDHEAKRVLPHCLVSNREGLGTSL